MKNKLNWMLSAIMVAVIVGVAGCNNHSAEKKEWRVAITYLGPHELINQIVAGFRSELGTELDGKHIVLLERNASGNETQISPMLNGVLSEHPDVLATITTPVSQQAYKNAPASIPVIFVGVTDPVGAHLAKTLEQPEWTTGVSDVPPLEKTLETIRALTPSVKRIGFIYSPNEQPAVYSRQQVEALGPKYGFVVEARSVTSQDELSALVRDLVRRNDAIMVGADNAMFAAAPVLSKIALDAHKPLFAADSSSVKAGALAGVTVDYTDVGKAGAKVVKSILRGGKVASTPVVSLTDGVLEVNSSTMKKLGVPLPPTLTSQVGHTYP